MTKTSDIPPQLEASVEEKRKFARDWTEMIEFISSRQLDGDWVVRVQFHELNVTLACQVVGSSRYLLFTCKFAEPVVLTPCFHPTDLDVGAFSANITPLEVGGGSGPRERLLRSFHLSGGGGTLF